MAIRTTAMADGTLNLVVTDMDDTKCCLPFSDNVSHTRSNGGAWSFAKLQ